MEIPRLLLSNTEKKMFKKKAIIILGPLQIGKTTLANTLLKDKNFFIF